MSCCSNNFVQGASAILEYNAVRSPLGQPRNALLGHTFSAIIGVAVSKLFQMHSDYERIKWIAGAIGCACASAVMLLTGTVHPPGGASAVLAATEPAITAMGWYFVGLVAWGSTLMMIVGLFLNNIQRQFPVYWWTPLDIRRAKKQDIETLETLYYSCLGPLSPQNSIRTDCMQNIVEKQRMNSKNAKKQSLKHICCQTVSFSCITVPSFLPPHSLH